MNEQTENSTSEQLARLIKEAAEGLSYISETDAPISAFVGKPAEALTKDEVLNQTKNSATSQIEEKDVGGFFSRLTEMQDWFGDEEKANAEKFAALQKILVNNLRDLNVFRIGKTQIKIYVLGLDENNMLLGIKTEAVET